MNSMLDQFSLPSIGVINDKKWVPVLASVFFVLSTNAGAVEKSPSTAPIGLPQDWSQRHMVYSNPDTPEEAAKKGQTAKWRKNFRDPRFVLALSRKLEASAAAKGPMPLLPRLPWRNKPLPHVTESGVHRDWSQVLGGAAGVGTPGVYPAKYSFDIYAAPDCANDFVVYSTRAAGATQVVNGTNNERRTLTFAGDAGNGNRVTLGTAGAARTVVLTASATLNTGQNFQNITDDTTRAANLAAAANRWSHQTGITATNAAGVVTFRRNTFGNLAAIGITSTLNNETVGGNTNGAGTAGQPTIIAFNQIYSSCNNDDPKQPRVFWSYNTGTGKIVETSPVISYYDGGKQVAFIQRNPTPNPDQLELVLLKWGTTSTGTAGAPAIPPTAASAADYRNNTGACNTTAGCMRVIPFSGQSDTDTNGTFSSPFVDYSGDVLWVGDGNGNLHKFTGIFSGTPAEQTTGGFPVAVDTGNTLSSPVYDFGGGNIYVGSGGAGVNDGRIYQITPAGASTRSARIADSDSNVGVRAAPLVDSSAGMVYAFVFNDDTSNCGGAGCRAVVQFAAGSIVTNDVTTGTKVTIGAGANASTRVQYAGTFDDSYYSSPTPDGAMYVCGGAPTDPTLSVLWKITITNNVMSSAAQGPSVSSTGATGDCSPISEVKNGSNDYLYFSVPDRANDGTATVCGNGAAGDRCLYMFNLSDLNGATAGTGAVWATTNVPSAGLTVSGGTGGIIMDNISNVPGTSQIYFSNTTSPGNAYQASQGGLQ
jgi:hypothetical protein